MWQKSVREADDWISGGKLFQRMKLPPKWHILCRVAHNTLLTHSLTHSRQWMQRSRPARHIHWMLWQSTLCCNVIITSSRSPLGRVCLAIAALYRRRRSVNNAIFMNPLKWLASSSPLCDSARCDWRLWTEHNITPPRSMNVTIMWTNSELKCRNMEIITPTLFADRIFRLTYNSTHNSYQARVSLRRYTAAIYTVIQKKRDTLLMSITSRNINRFSNSFHCWTQHKLCYKIIVVYPTTP